MKILFFSRLFYPHIGGVETHVLEVSKRLVKKGLEVVVVSESSTSEESRSLSRHHPRCFAGVAIFQIPVGKAEFLKKFRIWWWLWRHRSIIREADIVHCHDIFFWYLPFRLFYFKKPVFTTFHGYETKFPPAKKAILIRKLSEKLSWGNICVGQYLQKWYGTKADFVTYGGVSVNKIQNSTLRLRSGQEVKSQNFLSTLSSRPKSKVRVKILFIGRLEEDTGIKIYLEALKILKENGVDYEFEACGDGSLRAQVEKYGKVHGFVRDLSSHLARSGLARLDIIFSSSYLSILEAIRRRKLVFSAYNNPLKEDYLKMAPFARWIIIEKTPEKIAEKIIYFLNNAEKGNKKITGAYKWVKEQTWDQVVGLYLGMYNRLVH